MDEKKKNLLFPPSHRVLHWCTRAVATLLPNTQRSPDTPTATGDTNPVLKGKKNPQGDATEFGESGAEREPQPCTSGRRTAATPAARTRARGGKASGKPRRCSAPSPGGTAPGPPSGEGAGAFCAPTEGAAACPGRLSPGPTAGWGGAARPRPGPSPCRAPTLSPRRAEPPPRRRGEAGPMPQRRPGPGCTRLREGDPHRGGPSPPSPIGAQPPGPEGRVSPSAAPGCTPLPLRLP